MPAYAALSIAARCHARRFRHLCSKKLLYPDSIVVYGLIAEIVHVADSLGVAAGEVLGGKEEPLVLVVGQLLDIGIGGVFLHCLLYTSDAADEL